MSAAMIMNGFKGTGDRGRKSSSRRPERLCTMPLSEVAAVEAPGGEVTQLLRQAAMGNEAAQNELFRLVFPRLRRYAANKIRREMPGNSLSARTLVVEAWMRLADQEKAPENSAQFFGIFILTMKRILLDYAKRKLSEKRGGRWHRVPLDEGLMFPQKQAEELLDIDRCLEKLEKEYPRQAKVVDLRFFGGLTNAEVAEEIGVSLATVEADWRFARAWLRLELSDDGY